MTRRLALFVYLGMLISLSACIAVDSRASRERIDVKQTANLDGRFACSPSYLSQSMGLVGPPNLSMVFGGANCTAATIKASEGPVLTVTYDRLGVLLEPRIIDAAHGLSMDKSGEFIISTKAECGGGLAVGCDKNHMSLFINEGGDLVAIQSGGGGGLFMFIPVGVYAKLMAIFPRSSD